MPQFVRYGFMQFLDEFWLSVPIRISLNFVYVSIRTRLRHRSMLRLTTGTCYVIEIFQQKLTFLNITELFAYVVTSSDT